MCVCVCVCERERERERDTHTQSRVPPEVSLQTDGASMLYYQALLLSERRVCEIYQYYCVVIVRCYRRHWPVFALLATAAQLSLHPAHARTCEQWWK